MLPFALTIFTGAFLLFLVQPLIGKYILPWFGGTPGVWTTCMLFFQLVLLAGYAYAHFLSRWLKPRGQAVVHLALLLVSLAVLPIVPADAWKPTSGDAPITHILLLLGATIGLPYFVVSTTGPLMQAWFARLNPGISPYRLYALSNIGSLLALLAYPFLIEPNVARKLQAHGWGWGLAAYVVCAAWCAWLLWKRGVADEIPVGGSAPEEEPEEVPSMRRKFLWLALPACASALLLATTNKLTQDVAVIPFLWILPLSLYLLTFILCFADAAPVGFQRPLMVGVAVAGLAALLIPMMIDHSGSDSFKELLRMMNLHEDKSANRLIPFFCALAFISWHGYWRPLFMPAMIACFAWLIYVLANINDVRIAWQIAAFCTTMFVACMVCHGELYAQKPHPRRLTGYYLMISVGGALGGFLVAVVAPHVFTTYAELAWSCAACAVLVWLVCLPDWRVPNFQWWRFHAWMAGSLVAMAVCLTFFIQSHEKDNVIESTRNFYGAMSVLEYGSETPGSRYLLLQHGRITHGFQLTDPDQRRRITSYYGEQSGVALAIRNFPRMEKRIGVVGLGTGTTAAFGNNGDYVRIYEINSEVKRLATGTNRFTFVHDTIAIGGKVDIIMGDARLSMEREDPQRFDVLALDAFSSDAIPVHLLTKEAVAIYGRHLATNGVLAIHISNRYLDLEPVVENVAKEFGYERLSISDGDGEKDWWIYSSTWVLLSKNKELMALIASRSESAEKSAKEPSKKIVPLWTDDYASLLPIMSW
ncbi:MAG: fused MFS/spermidine synthase [Limisphaerales bacterium]